MVTPQPTRQATSNGIDGSIFTTELLCTTMYGLKVPSSVIGKTGWPSGVVTRLVPSETAGPPSSPAPRSHRLRSPRLTRRTLAARRDERQHHVVAGCDVLDAGADLGDDACALVAAQHREAGHRDVAGDQVVVGVAHARRFHLDLDLVLDGVADLDLLDRPRLVELPDESALCLHPYVPSTRASEARLEPLVRCVTPTPKQLLGRASPDRDRCLAERVVAGQLLAGHGALDPLLHAVRTGRRTR